MYNIFTLRLFESKIIKRGKKFYVIVSFFSGKSQKVNTKR